MSSLKAKIAWLTLMKPEEQKAAVASFVMVFILMAVYFILRPVRDAMASDWSDTEVSVLWNIQFFLSSGLVMLYCFVINHLRLRHVVPAVYSLFAVSFLVFYFVTVNAVDVVWAEKAFYLWVTSFSLLNISVFWSFMGEVFSKKQGQRLFPIIGSGASAGAILGPVIPVMFADSLGLPTLMLVAAMGLLLVVPIVLYLLKSIPKNQHKNKPIRPENQRIKGQWWSGFRDTFTHPLLFGIAIFILLYVFINSFVYFQQKNLLAEFSRADRAQILGGIDWVVNVLTFVVAFVVTGRMVKRMGMALTLASIPLAMVFGFVILALAPMVIILLGVQMARRVGNYSITRPAREMLFTQVSQEQRFKAKPVIDVVIYRGGDAASATVFASLTDGIGVGMLGMSIIGAVVAGFWAVVGFMLGSRFTRAKEGLADSSVAQQDIKNTNNHLITGKSYEKV